MNHMDKNRSIKKLATLVPPWGIISTALILLPILAFMTVSDINRQKAGSTHHLLEKGAALIRSFEAGTRAGMMMEQWDNPHLQRLLEETAQQPDIVYLLVVNTKGIVLAHSAPDKIYETHGSELDLHSVAESGNNIYRVIEKSKNTPAIFEVYSKFSPVSAHMDRMRRMDRRHGMMMQRWFERQANKQWQNSAGEHIIFVGLDMTEVEKARMADMRHSLLMAALLLLAGSAGVILLFMTYSYRATQSTLTMIKSFSDSLVENMPVGLISLNKNGTIIAINPAAVNILKLSGGSIIDKSAAEVLPEELTRIFYRLGTAKKEIEEELDCYLKNQKSLPLGLSASAWHDEAGTFMGHIMLVWDLTEIHELRKEIARSQRMASLGSLAAGVAHEIRNPLSSIKGFATYFREQYKDQKQDFETASIMISEVDRLNRVVGQLLELARPVELVKKSINLNTLFANSIALIKARAEEKNISIDMEVSEPDLTLTADSDRISQVLLNLYLNAIEAMEKDNGTLSVSACKSIKEPGVLISVTDNGSGIKKEALPHVFDPYFTSKSTGTGIGLAIVHNIIEAHEGSITVTSNPGEKTAFTLFFPERKKGENDA
jgi:two-component system sensor histidine kinase HydH